LLRWLDGHDSVAFACFFGHDGGRRHLWLDDVERCSQPDCQRLCACQQYDRWPKQHDGCCARRWRDAGKCGADRWARRRRLFVAAGRRAGRPGLSPRTCARPPRAGAAGRQWCAAVAILCSAARACVCRRRRSAQTCEPIRFAHIAALNLVDSFSCFQTLSDDHAAVDVSHIRLLLVLARTQRFRSSKCVSGRLDRDAAIALCALCCAGDGEPRRCAVTVQQPQPAK
jgi:hypothetical protein